MNLDLAIELVKCKLLGRDVFRCMYCDFSPYCNRRVTSINNSEKGG